MKNKLLNLAFWIIILFYSFQIYGNDTPRTTIYGKVSTNDTCVYLKSIDYLFPYNSETMVCELKDGQFKFQLDISEPKLYRLFTNIRQIKGTDGFLGLVSGEGFYLHPCYNFYKGVSEVFIEPGDSLFVDLKFDKYGNNTSEFVGNNSSENAFLVKYRHKTVNKRGNWAMTYFGLGGDYRELKTDRIIRRNQKETNKYSKLITRNSDFSNSFKAYLLADNQYSSLHRAICMINYIHSNKVKEYFKSGDSFDTYCTLFNKGIKVDTISRLSRSYAVYLELLLNYELNRKNQTYRPYYIADREKYLSINKSYNNAMTIELKRATMLLQMSKEKNDTVNINELIEDYKQQYPNSDYLTIIEGIN